MLRYLLLVMLPTWPDILIIIVLFFQIIQQLCQVGFLHMRDGVLRVKLVLEWACDRGDAGRMLTFIVTTGCRMDHRNVLNRVRERESRWLLDCFK